MIRITLVYASAPREVKEEVIDLPDGTCVRDALKQAAWATQCQALADGGLTAGIWGRKSAGDAILRDGDRLEIYRPLRVDPKVARRERFVGQGARGAGLFAQRRPNSKAGY